MTWFRVDDAWWSHKKVASLSLAARGLWVTAGAWCAQQLEDGRVPRGVLTMLGGNAKVAAELVRSGLWETTPDGWLIHDWHKYQPSRADVEKEREQKRVRQRKWRGKDGAVDASTQPSNDTSITASVTPAPSRPDPTRPVAAAASDPPEAKSGEVPVLPLSPRELSIPWHRGMRLSGLLGAAHSIAKWEDDFGIAARGVMGMVPPPMWREAATAVCMWFWLGSDGPVVAERINPWSANPGHLAKYISSDLRRANAWWAEHHNEFAEGLQLAEAEAS